MKTAISLPDELFNSAERAAGRLGLSRSELYRRALQAFLREHDDKLITDALNEVYGDIEGDIEGGRQLDPALSQMQSLSLGKNPPKEDW